MVRTLMLSAVAVFMTTAPLYASPPVIPNPARCAAVYPNANCQNYGPGNPYTSYGWAPRPWHRWQHGHYYHYRR